MRKITLLLMLLLLAAYCVTGCIGDSLLSEDNKQITVSATPMIVPLEAPFGGGIRTNMLQYGIRQLVNLYGAEVGRRPVRPLAMVRFDLYVETYDINQEFEVFSELPDATTLLSGAIFPTYKDVVVAPSEFISKIPISDNGRGPGGIVIIPSALWAPKETIPELWGNYEIPTGQSYYFEFIVKDTSGHVGTASAVIHVVDMIIETQVTS